MQVPRPFTLVGPRARARPAARARRASRRATGGCSASTAAPSCAAARPTTRCSPRRRSSASCSRSCPGTSARRRSRSRSTSRSASAAPTPTRSSSPRPSSRPRREIIAASDARVNPGQLRQLELWQSSLPLGRDVARLTRKYVTRHVGDTVPLVGTSCGSPTGIPFAFTDPGREVALINPFDPAHDNGTLLVNARSGGGKTFLVNVLLARLPRARHAGVRARPRRPLRVPLPAHPRRAAPDDRRLERRARRQPVGRRGPGEPADREDRLPRRAARAARRRPPRRRGLLRPRRARAQPARGRDPRRLRARRPRAASRRARRCCARSCAAAPSEEAAGRRRGGRRRRCARWPSGSPRSSTTAPTPTCSTARRPCPPTRRWSPSTPARSRASCRPRCCSCSPSTSPRRIERRGARAPARGRRRAVRRPLDARHRRGVEARRAPRDRRVGQRHRPPLPPPRPVPGRDLPAALGLRRPVRQGAAPQLHPAAVPAPVPRRARLHQGRRPALRRRGRARSPAEDGQALLLAGVLDQRHPRPRHDRPARRPDRVRARDLRPRRRPPAPHPDARRRDGDAWRALEQLAAEGWEAHG